MYAKVFRQMFYGSMYARGDAQLVFVCLLAHADADGNAELPAELIGSMTGIGTDRAAAALGELQAPDSNSRLPAEEGRRIVGRGDGFSWSIVNHGYYRGLRDEEDRRRQNRENKRRERERKGARHPSSATVSLGHPPSSHAEAHAEAEAHAQNTLSPMATWTALFEQFWQAYPHHQRRSHRKLSLEAWQKITPKTEARFAEIMSGLAKAKATDWVRDGGQYVEAAERWLRRESWNSSDGAPGSPDSPYGPGMDRGMVDDPVPPGLEKL